MSSIHFLFTLPYISVRVNEEQGHTDGPSIIMPPVSLVKPNIL